MNRKIIMTALLTIATVAWGQEQPELPDPAYEPTQLPAAAAEIPAEVETPAHAEQQPMVVGAEAARLNTMGISVGISINKPLLNITVHGTYAPIRHLFLEAGCDVGSFSMSLFARAGFFMPFTDNIGWYIGAGGGYMAGKYIFDFDDKAPPVSIFAADFIVGLNAAGFDMSYTVRTNFDSLSSKLLIGYSYRFK